MAKTRKSLKIADTDSGVELRATIDQLKKLVNAYRSGVLVEKES